MKIDKIIILSDHNGYFEKLTKDLLSEVNNPLIKEVIVTSGTHRVYDLDVQLNSNGVLSIDYRVELSNPIGTTTDSRDNIINYLNRITPTVTEVEPVDVPDSTETDILAEDTDYEGNRCDDGCPTYPQTDEEDHGTIILNI